MLQIYKFILPNIYIYIEKKLYLFHHLLLLNNQTANGKTTIFICFTLKI